MYLDTDKPSSTSNTLNHAAPVFMIVNSAGMFILLSRLHDARLASFIRVEAGMSLIAGVGILIWSSKIGKKESRDKYGVDRPSLFMTFFFLPIEVIFFILSIECLRFTIVGDRSVRNGLLIQLFATFIIWLAWEVQSAIKAIG